MIIIRHNIFIETKNENVVWFWLLWVLHVGLSTKWARH